MKINTGFYFAVIAILYSSCLTNSFNEAELHQTFKLGSSVAELLPVIKLESDSIKQFDYTGEMAAPFTQQTQINGYGMKVLGKKRKVEFLFNDGPLGHVWILIDEKEIPSITEELESLCGEIIYTKDDKRVFNSGTVAIQSNPPEVLIANAEMIQALTGYTQTK